jgi:hypothetical protein
MRTAQTAAYVSRSGGWKWRSQTVALECADLAALFAGDLSPSTTRVQYPRVRFAGTRTDRQNVGRGFSANRWTRFCQADKSAWP